MVMIQKSYEKGDKGKLYLIPTPIGNLEDITLRAINILKEVDIIFAEDTRETMNLLKNFNISKKIESCHKYSEAKNKDKIINILNSGKNIGYVTDRGTPLISDPGNLIVNYVIENNIDVIALPGPSALLPAINMSGLSNRRFLFYGFLDSKQSHARKELIDLKEEKNTIIIYESPFRIKDTLKLIYEILGNRKIAIAREISKIHEEVIRDNVSNIINNCDKIKGEVVIIIEGYIENSDNSIDFDEEIKKLMAKNYTKRDAIIELSEKYNVSKNKLYNEYKE